MRISSYAAKALAAAALLSAAAATPAAEPAAVTDVTRTTCAELAGDTQENRAFALMFYYGYMAGSSGAKTIEDAKVPGHLAAVRDYCNANPKSTVVAAFAAALRPQK